MQIGWVDALVAMNGSILSSTDRFSPRRICVSLKVPASSGRSAGLALIVTMLFALPLAVMAAIYLEYFARPGRMTDFIEVNINNLAAVPRLSLACSVWLFSSAFSGCRVLPQWWHGAGADDPADDHRDTRTICCAAIDP